jgi:hypothetical protein
MPWLPSYALTDRYRPQSLKTWRSITTKYHNSALVKARGSIFSTYLQRALVCPHASSMPSCSLNASRDCRGNCLLCRPKDGGSAVLGLADRVARGSGHSLANLSLNDTNKGRIGLKISLKASRGKFESDRVQLLRTGASVRRRQRNGYR